jgi:hypothetical protein
MTLKQKARKTKEFAQRHGYEIAYVTYVVGCFALGYWGTKKFVDAYNADVQRAVEHETLRMAVAAGHDFQFDPKSNTLWDVTIRPDMKVG